MLFYFQRFATSVCFLLSLLLLWAPYTRILPFFCFILGLCGAVWSDLLTPWGLALIALFYLFVFVFKKKSERASLALKSSLGLVILVLGFIFLKHLAPGVYPWHIGKSKLIPTWTYPHNFNIDHASVAFPLLLFLIPLSRTKADWIQIAKKVPLFWIGTTIIMALLAFIAGVLKWHVHFSYFSPLWIILDLFGICVAQEALLRGFLQRELQSIFGKRWPAHAAAILIGAFLMSLLHIGASNTIVFLVFAAGICYGLVYKWSAYRIEAPILVSFLLNLTIYISFSYPTF